MAGVAGQLKRRAAYSTGDVVKILSCNPRTVCNMIDRGDLEGYKIGTDRRIPHESLEAYLKSQPGLRHALARFQALGG